MEKSEEKRCKYCDFSFEYFGEELIGCIKRNLVKVIIVVIQKVKYTICH